MRSNQTPKPKATRTDHRKKLTLAFATADVTLTGWRLNKICDDLRDGRLLAVRTLHERYAHLGRNKPHALAIEVRPVKPE